MFEYWLTYNENTGQYRVEHSGLEVKADSIDFMAVGGYSDINVLWIFAKTMVCCARLSLPPGSFWSFENVTDAFNEAVLPALTTDI